MKKIVLCHGRHLGTVGWETLVWGDGEKIGTAPFALYLAVREQAELVFGTGASELDGVKECVFTRDYLLARIAEVTQFPEFAAYRADGAYERAALLGPVVQNAHLDTESMNTDQEVLCALEYAKLTGASELLQVTSTFHAPRCIQAIAKLADSGYDFGGVLAKVLFARSSTATCNAATTVILEYPHRGDDQMLDAPLKPHQIFPRMFKLQPLERIQFLLDTDSRLVALGK